MIILALICVPICGVLLAAEKLLLLGGQTPEVAAMTAAYVRLVMFNIASTEDVQTTCSVQSAHCNIVDFAHPHSCSMPRLWHLHQSHQTHTLCPSCSQDEVFCFQSDTISQFSVLNSSFCTWQDKWYGLNRTMLWLCFCQDATLRCASTCVSWAHTATSSPADMCGNTVRSREGLGPQSPLALTIYSFYADHSHDCTLCW